MAKPTIVIVPGAFAPPTIYKDVVEKLRAKGYPALAVQTPSTQKRIGLEPATMKDDADIIKRIAGTLISQGKEVVVVCHSYGGTPTTEALANVKVKRIVYMTAIVPKVGQSQVMALGMEAGVLPMEAIGGYMHMDAAFFAAGVGNDLPWDLAYENTTQFLHHSGASFLEPVTHIAYKDLPVSYIVCEKDVVVSPDAQRKYIKVIEEARGKKVDVVSIESGHCPNWSQPEKLAELIVGEAERE